MNRTTISASVKSTGAGTDKALIAHDDDKDLVIDSIEYSSSDAGEVLIHRGNGTTDIIAGGYVGAGGSQFLTWPDNKPVVPAGTDLKFDVVTSTGVRVNVTYHYGS